MVLKQLVVFADSDVSLRLETVADQAAISSNTVSPAPLKIRRSTVCIEYDFTKIKDEQFRRGINKVIYSNKRPKREDYDNDYDYTIAVLATKSEEWSYEKEWRLNYVLPYGQAIDKYYPVYYAKEAITSIYMGCNIDKVKKEKIVECYSDRGLPVFEMRLSDNEFDFSFVKVN